MLVTLPNGILESNGHELFDVVKLDELRGKQQNYLADEELMSNNFGHLPKILDDMILELRDQSGNIWKGKKAELVNKLTASDIETILIKIRENTFGPKYIFKAECPHCQKDTTELKVELNELKIEKLSHQELLLPKIIKLPKSNKEVEFKNLTLKDILASLTITTKNKDKLFTSLTSLLIKRIDDETNVTSETLESLPLVDINALGELSENFKLTGNIDTDIEVTCSNRKCKKDFVYKLNPFDPRFFVHTGGSMS